MPNVFEVMDKLTNAVVAALAPFQPNELPDFPNTASTAGVIPSTMTAIGHPVQYPVTEKLENKKAQVGVIEGEVEKFEADIQTVEPISVTGSVATYEVGRSKKQIKLQIWSYDLQTREAIAGCIRAQLGDSFRLTQDDGSITLFVYTNEIPFDQEQKDTIWIKEIHYMADYSVTVTAELYTITSIEALIAIRVAGTTVETETITITNS